MPDMIDWDLAAATARRLARPGPAIPMTAAADVVAELRDAAARAERHVEDYTGLVPALRTPTAVVDRAEWVRSNAASMRLLITPLTDKLSAKRSRGSTPVDAVGRRITGVQVGSILAFLASRVLGQYEIFLPEGEGDGRLTLVAPNIVAAEQALEVDVHDFRLWVCLHEQAHRTQFTAVPWMRGHLQGLVVEYVEASDLDPAALLGRVLAAVRSAIAGGDGGVSSMTDLLQTPAQREVLARVQALMTLLEGHAEHVMDAVGPQVVPSVARIREAFDGRRGGGPPLDRVLRRLLGLEAKMRQYKDGARFVGAVVAEVGVSGFNRVWESPQTLPTPAEITDPGAWVARVHGRPVAA